jgi:hypothetical protein
LSSPPRLDPLGRQVPSRGPIPRSTKSSFNASALSAPRTAGAPVSAERLRDVVRAGVAPSAVLQCRVPHGGHTLAAVEGAAALPSDRWWAGMSLRAESPPPSAPGAAADGRPRRAPLTRSRVGHRPAKNFHAPAIARAAMPASRGPAAPRCNDSAPAPVGGRSHACSNESAGGSAGGWRGGAGASDRRVMERRILQGRACARTFTMPTEKGGGRSRPGLCRSLLFERGDG